MQQFTATISITLTFTREEVEHLAICATNHYDHKVNAMVPPGEGAIINGMRFWLTDPAATQVESVYQFRQIDRLHKAIEFQDDPLSMQLKKRFHRALRHLNSMSESVNKMLADWPTAPLD